MMVVTCNDNCQKAVKGFSAKKKVYWLMCVLKLMVISIVSEMRSIHMLMYMLISLSISLFPGIDRFCSYLSRFRFSSSNYYHGSLQFLH